MADYPLDQLGDDAFEQMTQALLAAHIGPLSVKVYGAGRDGGREMTTHATFELPAADDRPAGDRWSGYTVVQAKFHARPRDTSSNATWLAGRIRAELRDWVDPDKARYPKPDNLVFVTNVVLSAVPGSGVDAVEAVFDEFPQLQLKNTAILHYDHVCRLLDNNAHIRGAYMGLLTAGDVLTQIHHFVAGEAVDIGRALRRHAVKELLAEQWVRLGAAGSTTSEKLRLAEVAVDLSAHSLVPVERGRTGKMIGVHEQKVDAVIAHTIQRGDAVLRPSLVTDRKPPHLVLVGGPGQGKTTIVQQLCQIYRAALVDDLPSLGPAGDLVTAIRQHADHAGMPTPAMRRWPLRLELARYAEVLGGSPDLSVLRHLSTLITERSAETITAGQLKTWLGTWPWLLVLDGFDEVAAPQVREAMIDRINDLLIDAADVDADLLIIATTRPHGYAAEFSAGLNEHLQLADLTRQQAISFATTLTDARLADDPDAHRNVTERIREAADDPLTARLMITPLQVTIMSLLLEGRPRVPQDRYGLFDAYYRTIYDREVAKPTPIGRLLDQHRATIDEVHARVGLELQIRTERLRLDPGVSERVVGALPQTQVEDLARQILLAEEFSAREAERLASQIAQAAMERLVLLVPKHLVEVGFDVRSLQELMAARALTTGDVEQVLERLRLTALSAHWRNTWLLAAGRLASRDRHLVDRILALLGEVGTASYLDSLLQPAAHLALDLLDDRFAAPSPRVERILLERAVGALRVPPTLGTLRSAEILQRVSVTAGPAATALITQVTRESLGAGPPQQITALIALEQWSQTTGSLAALRRQRVSDPWLASDTDMADALNYSFIWPASDNRDRRSVMRYRSLGSFLQPEAGSGSGLLEVEEVLLRQLLAAFDGWNVALHGSQDIVSVHGLPRLDWALIDPALGEPAVGDYLAERLMALKPEQWAIASAVAETYRQYLQQRRVAHLLMDGQLRTK